ncbi:MAG: methylated-DNA--[protein]-cysteine S-methyltransferase [Halofilum sp. (in: g-proteobacteria)]
MPVPADPIASATEEAATLDYRRIAEAIAYIAERVHEQPSLEEIAAHVHLSPFHFQRLFTRWAGTTPKRFLQVLTLERSKRILAEAPSLLDLSTDMGLSSTSRLHEHFVRLDAVTPGEYKRHGLGLTVRYGSHETPFGPVFVAMTARGISRAAFLDDRNDTTQLAAIRSTWPDAQLVGDEHATREVAHAIAGAKSRETALPLFVGGTNFQIAVWRAMLRVPPGTRVSYTQLAAAVGRPRATRAVGNAVGANPIAMLIPCHRVILSSGALGGYRWGSSRKRVIQAWEQARAEGSDPGAVSGA